MNQEERTLFTDLSRAVGISLPEIALAMGMDQDTLQGHLQDEDSEYHKIYNREYIIRKANILNAVLDAAERDSPEAQKAALRLMERRDMEWERRKV